MAKKFILSLRPVGPIYIILYQKKTNDPILRKLSDMDGQTDEQSWASMKLLFSSCFFIWGLQIKTEMRMYHSFINYLICLWSWPIAGSCLFFIVSFPSFTVSRTVVVNLSNIFQAPFFIAISLMNPQCKMQWQQIKFTSSKIICNTSQTTLHGSCF